MTKRGRVESVSGAHKIRRLTNEEFQLWVSVAKTVNQMPDSQLPDRPKFEHQQTVMKPATKLSQRSYEAPSYSPPGESLSKQTLPLAPLERRLKQRLLKGRTSVDGALDLHGMRQEEAFQSLWRFLARAQNSGNKTVVIITGKGRSGGNEQSDGRPQTGVLRRIVPQWLRAQELRHIVLGFDEAAPSHGGSGALYVRLRRRN